MSTSNNASAISSNSEGQFAPRAKCCGRSRELNAIAKALSSLHGGTRAMFFIGQGGIGKTRLLEEAKKIADDHAGPVLCRDIIDLYHSEFHSVEGLRNGLAESLDSDQKWFTTYRAAARNLEARQRAGLPVTDLQKLEQAATDAFTNDYRALAQEQIVLLRFDTLEVMQHESDAVQKLCDLGQEELGVRAWLMALLPKLPNTLVLAASRPPLAFQPDALGMSSEAYKLDQLDFDATKEYVQSLSAKEPKLGELTDAQIQRLQKITRGKPIRLSLAIELCFNGEPEDPWGFITAQDDQDLDIQFADALRQCLSPEHRVLIRYMALARKGLDVELLRRLESKWTREQCVSYLEDMKDFAFVKTHPKSARLFLHDELARIYNIHGLGEHPDTLLDSVVAYYDHKLKGSMQGERAFALELERLYYELRRDGRAGFARYQALADRALAAGDLSHDMALRDELLRFINDPTLPDSAKTLPSEDELNRDAALRWMQRHIAKGQNPEAAEIGRRLVDENHSWFATGDAIYRGSLRVSYALALIYSKASESKSIELLTRTIADLEAWRPEDRLLQMRRDRVLGQAHNLMGYSQRVHGRYEAARTKYELALELFRVPEDLTDSHGADSEGDLATTETNLGFLYGLKGQWAEAERHLEKARNINTKQKLDYPLGLSENTTGLSAVHSGKPVTGVAWCRKALNRFQSLGAPRGIGLARLALGFALRRQADLWKGQTYTPQQAEKHFSAAHEELLEAIRIFEEQVNEPTRLIEAYEEMGSLLCDWAWLVQVQYRKARTRHQQLELRIRSENLYSQAEDYLQRAARLAEEKDLTLQGIDALDDLSQVYHDRSQLYEEYDERRNHYGREGDALLTKIMAEAPKEYKLTQCGLQRIADAQEEWWLALGKVELSQGVRTLRQAMAHDISTVDKNRLVRDAAQHYAAAVAYFQMYSPNSLKMQETLASIYKRMSSLSRESLQEARTAIVEFEQEHNLSMAGLITF